MGMNQNMMMWCVVAFLAGYLFSTMFRREGFRVTDGAGISVEYKPNENDYEGRTPLQSCIDDSNYDDAITPAICCAQANDEYPQDVSQNPACVDVDLDKKEKLTDHQRAFQRDGCFYWPGEKRPQVEKRLKNLLQQVDQGGGNKQWRLIPANDVWPRTEDDCNQCWDGRSQDRCIDYCKATGGECK